MFTLSGGKNVPLYPTSQTNPSVNSDTDVMWNLMITQVFVFYDFSYFAVEANVIKKNVCPSIGNFEEFIL